MSCAALFCSVLFISCGLETFYKIAPPHDAVPQNPADGATLSVTTTADPLYEFWSENINTTPPFFIAPGTEVYYRIYNSVKKLQQDVRAINAVNTDIGGNGFSKMESLGYKKLRARFVTENQGLLIDGTAPHRVFMRLVSIGSDSAGVFYTSASGTPQFSPVLRNGDAVFYFNSSGDTQKLPKASDSDVDPAEDDGALAGKYWYVNAYAVSVGLVSATWTRSVSKLLPLGFLAFEKNGS